VLTTRHWAWLAALLLGLFAVACAGYGIASKPTTARPTIPARATYVAQDGHVYVIPLGGGDARRISQVRGQVEGETAPGTEVQSARWPTWSPDGSRVAFLRMLVDSGDEMSLAQVWTVAADGSDLRKVWEATEQEPIYLAWAPNSTLLGLLVHTEDNLELIVVDTVGNDYPRSVARGNPLYFVWSPDSREILLHTGSPRSNSSQPDLALVRLGPPDESRSLGVAPGDFRAPAWSGDGRRVAFVAAGPDRSGAVAVGDPHGGDLRRLASVTTETALALSPDGTRLAWSSRSEENRLLYDGVEIVGTDGGNRVRVSTDPVVAFFWSPDGQQLAYITLDRTEQTFIWNVAGASGKNPHRLTTFTPTEEQIRMLAFFDQYAVSHGVWSPDSQSLVYAASPAGDRRGLPVSTPGYVVSVPADGSGTPHTVVSGNLVAMPVAPFR
jgi:Tol biopolymer transport system component